MSSTDVRIQLPERYRVVRHVANGGMASVWAAEDSVLGRQVAVKVLAQHISADPGARTRFEREARTAAKVSDHPNVATIYDVGEHGGVPFIVMELFNGGSVADRMRTGTVPRSQAITWLEQAAAALDYAHGEGIVHRDVKPANLLLDDRGRVAVGDFGIARMVEDSSLTQAGQVLGTAAYLSPEQALGKDATDASDRYALAVVAFELLEGRRPFQGEHIAAQARQHVEDDVPTSVLGPEVDAVLQRGMAKDPDERYMTSGRFVEELSHAVKRGAQPASPPTEPTRPVRRAQPIAAAAAPPPATPPRGYEPQSGGSRRGVYALAALAALVLAAAAIALLAGGGDDDPSSDRGSATDTPARTSTQDDQPQDTQPQDTQPQETEPPAETQAPDTEPEDGAGPDTSGESPSALNDRGYSLLQGGDAAAAVAPLEAAVKGFEEQGDAAEPTTYGYALYNLGQAYLQSGRPADAIPMFERRLQVNPDDRPDVVRQAIADAEAQLNGAEPGTGNGKKPKKDKD